MPEIKGRNGKDESGWVVEGGVITYSHCQPYRPPLPDMKDTPVAMSPPKAPGILADICLLDVKGEGRHTGNSN